MKTPSHAGLHTTEVARCPAECVRPGYAVVCRGFPERDSAGGMRRLGDEMIIRKRQDWILRMIKGPDIIPVENHPGRYATRSTVQLTVDEDLVVIKPEDMMDLSNPEFLVAYIDNHAQNFRWDRISRLEFEDSGRDIAIRPAVPRTAVHRLIHFPLDKKAT